MEKELEELKQQKEELVKYISESRESLMTSISNLRKNSLKEDKTSDLAKMYLSGILLGLTAVDSYLRIGDKDVNN